MRAILKVMPTAQYQQWYQQEIAAAEKVLPLADKGKAVVMKLGCLACHSTDGTVKIGPTWKDLYGSKVTLSDGSQVTADDNYIRESMLVPAAKIVKGFPNVMPTFKGIITDDEITAVIAYLKTLSTTGRTQEKARGRPRRRQPPRGPRPRLLRLRAARSWRKKMAVLRATLRTGAPRSARLSKVYTEAKSSWITARRDRRRRVYPGVDICAGREGREGLPEHNAAVQGDAD